MASTAGVDLIYQVPSSALMAPLTRSFVADIKRFVKQQGIDLIRFSVESARMTGRRTICATGLAARGCCLSAPRRRRRVCRGSRGGQGVVQVELQPSADDGEAGDHVAYAAAIAALRVARQRNS